jgi:hypothetical protein
MGAEAVRAEGGVKFFTTKATKDTKEFGFKPRILCGEAVFR